MPSHRYRPRHAAPSAPSRTALPAGVLACAAGIAFVGLSSASTPSAASVVSAAVGTGRAAAPAAVPDPVAQEQALRRASVARAVAVVRAERDERDERRDRASRSARRPDVVRPVAEGPLTSPYGPRWGRLHAGLDFGVPVGTRVLAVADGVVRTAQYDADGYGYYVTVEHADGTTSLYAHLRRIVVERGRVQAGDVLGRSGNSGHSTGPHLHFELRTEQGPFDARPWLRQRGVRL